jgi:NAD+ synthase
MSIREVEFIKRVFKREKINKAVIAVSGGIDSGLALVLTVKALGAQNVFSLELPYGSQSTELSDQILDFVKLPPENRKVINIQSAVGIYSVKEKARAGNIMARVRMIYIYDLAKQFNALVVGTENKSEKQLGYYTRFGDEAGDILPLAHLYKTQVISLAKELGLPSMIINQPATAGLWPGQTDERELGFSYELADQVLQGEIKNIKVTQRLRQVDFKKRVPYTL